MFDFSMNEANAATADLSRPARAGTDRPAGPVGRRGVAIIGMSCLFPGAPDVDAYWRNILGKVDSITDPPPEAWHTDRYYDPDSSETDRVYCRRGGYLGSLVTFDPLDHGIPPIAVGGEPDQWLALKIAKDALIDAGYARPEEAVRRRTAVILGKGTYLNGGNAMAVQHGLVVGQTLELLKTLHPEHSEEDLETLRRELKKSLPPIGPETVPGLIPNIIVGRIANRLDLMGPTYTVDAACASSLVAVQMAMRDLVNGECDLALAGGSQVWIPMPAMSIFCQLGALSRTQQIRPFDKDADGTLLGEGIGMVVLKRLEDAERDGDRIYAVIRGVGVASDGRGATVMAPRVEGEELALRRAYETAGVSPRTIGLIEAHGTGTPVGDMVEIQALTRVFGGRDERLPWCALGSVKSMISHTIPASGVAGIIKTSLALHHKVLPPLLNCNEPNPALELDKSPFYINTETRPWVHAGKEPRRAGVNSFGFGGINAHAVLEEYVPGPAADRRAARPGELAPARRRDPNATAVSDHLPDWETEVCILGAESPAHLLERVRRLGRFLESDPAAAATNDPGAAGDGAFRLKDLAYTLNRELMTSGGETGCRLAVVASSVADLREKLGRAAGQIAEPGCRRIRDRSGIYYAAEPLGRDGKLAFLFPGEGAQYPNMLADLCLHFPEARECFDRADRVYADHPRGYVPSDYIFPRPSSSRQEGEWAEAQLWRMDGAIEAVLTADLAMLAVLEGLGLRPDAIVGHSSGEYAALRAAGVLDLHSEAHWAWFARELNRDFEQASAQDGVPQAMLLAVGGGRDQVDAIAREAGAGLHVAMDNCPHQVVLIGEGDVAERAIEIVRREGLISETLAFDRPYHTPLFAPFTDHLRQVIDQLPLAPARIPIYSCTTAAPFPDDFAEVRTLMLEHWLRPVEFRRTIEALYDEGVRLFVEVGPRGNLTAFAEDILRGRPSCVISADSPRRPGTTQLNHLVGLLAVHGVEMDLAYLQRRRDPRQVAWAEGAVRPAPAPAGLRIKLNTGFPEFKLPDDVVRRFRESAAAAAASRLPAPPPVASPADDAPPEPTIVREEGSLSDHPTTAGPAPFDPVAEAEAVPTAPTPGADPVMTPPQQFFADAMADEGPLPLAIQDYFRTMEQFLQLQQRAFQGCVRPGPCPQAAPAIDAGRPDTPARNGSPHGTNGSTPGGPNREDWGGAAEAEPGPSSATVAHRVEGPGGAAAAAAVAVAVPSAGVPPVAPAYPLLGEIITWTPGEELVARRTFDPSEDRYLEDHTLGRDLSVSDPDLRALAVMPLTMSLEILAEAAAALMPGRTVVGLLDVRAYRWIAFEDRPQTLQVTARLRPGDGDKVLVRLRNLTEDEQGGDPPKSPVIEATVALAGSYPPPGAAAPRQLADGTPSRLRPDDLYHEHMFHGPSWQGVAAIEQTGATGAIARLRVLPFHRFFRSVAAPRFVLDPAVLDAAGQVIGFWTVEHLDRGRVIFPFRMDRLEIFGPGRPAGETLGCVASIELVGGQQVRSDIDVIAGDGRLWMRLIGWEDKRFDLPDRLSPLMDPAPREDVSEEWTAPIAHVSRPELFRCRLLRADFPSDRGFWKRVWAHRILGRAEREQFRRQGTAEARQLEWLGGRAAAKEAVRALLGSHHGLDVPPADIEIRPDERGRLLVDGDWRDAVPGAPVVSIAQAGGLAVAVAGLAPAAGGGDLLLGIDAEYLQARPPGFAEAAFDGEEVRAIRDSLPPELHEEWMLRSWCAKEATAKALGAGPVEGPRPLRIAAVAPNGGTVFVRLHGQLARIHPGLAVAPLAVMTRRQGDLIVATMLCEPAGAELAGEAVTVGS